MPPSPERQRRSHPLVGLLKVSFLAVLLLLFCSSIVNNNVFQDIWNGPKNVSFIVLGILVYFFAVGVGLLRWHFLVRALGIPIPFKETLRIGILTLFVSMLPMTALLGGDIFKAWMLSKFCKGKGAESAATILVDRFVGLFALFLFVTIASLAAGFHRIDDPLLRRLCTATFGVTIGFAVAAVLLLVCSPRIVQTVYLGAARLPWAGPFLARLAAALQRYRGKFGILAIAFSIGFLIQTLLTLSLHLFGSALFETFHGFRQNLAIIPLALGTIFIPISVGPLEIVLDWLYASTPLPDGTPGKSGVGLIVALGFRFYVLCLAGCGFLYYLLCTPSSSKAALRETLQEAAASTDGGENE